MEDYLGKVFDNLDSWRHLPSYQLERRADIFFSVYLPEIIEQHCGCRPAAIIPEFPVHIPTIAPETTANRSFKVDYLVVLPDKRGFVFVELKTDPSSRRSDQDHYLARVREVGVAALLAGLRRIYKRTQAKAKYDCLLRMLDDAGLIDLKSRGEFAILAVPAEARVLYIQPVCSAGDKDAMPFSEIADLVERHDDALSRRFATSLREWARVEAGGPKG